MTQKLTERIPKRYRGTVTFVFLIVVGVLAAFLITTYVTRSYRVDGISMEPTFHTGDVLLVNKLGKNVDSLFGRQYVPNRDQLVVFKNPFYNQGDPNAFVVKRVIGLPGDRVIVKDGRINVATAADPTNSFDPDAHITGPQSPTSGNVDRTVPTGEIFVAGDNRLGNNSLDSRNGMSTVPLDQVEGTVVARFWPLTKLQIF